MLDRHLERCSSCRTFAASVATFTSELRTAPLAVREGGGGAVFRSAHKRPRRAFTRPLVVRHRTLRLPLVALTAAAASMVMTSIVLHGGSVDAVPPSSPPVIVVDAVAEDDAIMLRGLRDISYARRLESDVSVSRRPGIFTG